MKPASEHTESHRPSAALAAGEGGLAVLLFGLLAVLVGIVAGLASLAPAAPPMVLALTALLAVGSAAIVVAWILKARALGALRSGGATPQPRHHAPASREPAAAIIEARQSLVERVSAWGLAALAFITYTRFSDVLIRNYGLPSIAEPLVGLLLLAIIGRWVSGHRSEDWVAPALLLASIGVVRFASLLYAADVGGAQAALEDFIKDAIIAVILIILLERGATLRRVVWALIAAGIFMGTISVHQYLTGSFDNSYMGFGVAGVMNIVGSQNDYRAAGPVGDPNSYAQIMLPLVALALDRLWYERSRLLRLVAAWALVVCTLTVIFTFSRGAFLALVAMLALLVPLYRPNPRYVIVALLLALPLLFVMPPTYTARITTIADVLPSSDTDPRAEVSFRGRTSEALAALMMFRDHPLLGVGFHNYPVYYEQYSRIIGLDPRREDRSAHSLYLEIAAETGLLGLTVFGALLWGIFAGTRRAHKTLTALGAHEPARMIAALRIGLIGYLIAAIFLHGAYARFLWLLVGIALAAPRIAGYERAIRAVVHRPDAAPPAPRFRGGKGGRCRQIPHCFPS